MVVETVGRRCTMAEEFFPVAETQPLGCGPAEQPAICSLKAAFLW